MARRRHWRLIAFGTLTLAGIVATGAAPARALEPLDPSFWNSAGRIRTQDEVTGTALLGVARRGGLNGGAAPFGATSQLDFVDPTSVSEVEFEVTVLDASVVGTGFPAAPAVRVDGFFYWDGTGSGGPLDATGHVLGNIRIAISQATKQLVAAYFAQKCLNALCSATQVLVNQAFPQPIGFFERHTLRIGLNRTTGVFTFQLDGNAPVTFTVPDAVRLVPAAGLMRIAASTVVPANPTAFGRFLAQIDNVKKNGVLYDDFNARRVPRVEFIPGSGAFKGADITADVVILVETGGEPLGSLNLFVNGQDLSGLLAQAVQGAAPNGGRTFKFPGVVLGSLIPPGQTLGVGAIATTQSGRRATGFAVWTHSP